MNGIELNRIEIELNETNEFIGCVTSPQKKQKLIMFMDRNLKTVIVQKYKKRERKKERKKE